MATPVRNTAGRAARESRPARNGAPTAAAVETPASTMSAVCLGPEPPARAIHTQARATPTAHRAQKARTASRGSALSTGAPSWGLGSPAVPWLMVLLPVFPGYRPMERDHAYTGVKMATGAQQTPLEGWEEAYAARPER